MARSQKTTFGSLLSEINRHRFKLLCILTASFGEAVLASFSVGMIIPIASNALNASEKPAFNIPLLQEFYPQSLQLAFIYLAVLIVLKTIFSVISKYFALLTAKDYRLDYTQAITNQYFFRKLNPTMSELIGHKLNNITRETNLAYLFVLLSIYCVQSALNMVALLVLMLLVNAKVVMIGLAGALFAYFTVGRYFLKLTGRYSKEAMKVNLDLGHQLINALGNIREIKLNNSFSFFSNKIRKSTQKAAHADVQRGVLEIAVPLLLEICFASALIILSFYIGLKTDFPKEQIAQLTFFIVALYRIFNAGNGLFTLVLKLRYSYPSFKLIKEFVDSENTKEFDENIEDGKKVPAQGDVISLQHIFYSYNESMPVLKDISLSFKPDHIYALVGPSGSGKSTLLNIIARLYKPHSGRILFGQENVENFSLGSWRDAIGYVSQEPSFFTDTILKNITMNRADISKNDVIESCKKVDIHDEIMKLPQGYDTQVFEQASNFSGGQQRRIALARALVKNPKILILDETTASVPVEDERQILRKIKEIKGLSIVFVTHRYSNLDMIDVVYELQEGSLREAGTT